jgi:hypothetical protein
MHQILFEAIHGIELRPIYFSSFSHIIAEMWPFGEIELLLGVAEVEVILIYLKGSYIAHIQGLLLLDSPSSDVVGEGDLLAADLVTDCLASSLRHVEQLHLIGDVFGSSGILKLKRTFVFVGLFDVHSFLFVEFQQLGATLPLVISCLVQFDEEVLLVVLVIDVHLDAILVVGSGKHQLSGQHFLAGQLALTGFQFLHSVRVSASKGKYLSVFIVFSDEEELGLTLQIITVLQKPTKESLSTIVNLLPLKGVCDFPWSKALMHSLRESKDLLISAPSILVCLFWSMWSAPRSFPAKSMKLIFVKTFF